MHVGIVGLGRMGASIAERLSNGGHDVSAYDRDPDARAYAAASGLQVVDDLERLVEILPEPRVIWLMVPSGNATEGTISALAEILHAGDVIIDGGNSNYNDSMRRGASLQHRGVRMIDAGVSGGVWGLHQGYCLMVGGDADSVATVESIFKTLAPTPDAGYAHVGSLGAGHFTKMVHNGIEYGLMQAYAEGFELMRAKELFDLDLAQVADVWRYGSIIRSWLLDLIASAITEDPQLEAIAPWVEDSGEGRWTVEESVELAVPMPVISMALQARFRSRDEGQFGFKLLAAMRNRFGGHSFRPGV